MILLMENTEKHNPYWPQISDHSCRIQLIGGSACGKTTSLTNPISHQPHTDQTCYMLRIHMEQNINC